jgi:hypothetical protein
LENLVLKVHPLNISRSGTGIKDIFLVLKNLIIFHILRTINSEKYYYGFSIKDKLFRTVFKILNDALPNGISKGRKNTPLNLFES